MEDQLESLKLAPRFISYLSVGEDNSAEEGDDIYSLENDEEAHVNPDGQPGSWISNTQKANEHGIVDETRPSEHEEFQKQPTDNLSSPELLSQGNFKHIQVPMPLTSDHAHASSLFQEKLAEKDKVLLSYSEPSTYVGPHNPSLLEQMVNRFQKQTFVDIPTRARDSQENGSDVVSSSVPPLSIPPEPIPIPLYVSPTGPTFFPGLYHPSIIESLVSKSSLRGANIPKKFNGLNESLGTSSSSRKGPSLSFHSRSSHPTLIIPNRITSSCLIPTRIHSIDLNKNPSSSRPSPSTSFCNLPSTNFKDNQALNHPDVSEIGSQPLRSCINSEIRATMELGKQIGFNFDGDEKEFEMMLSK